MINTKHTHAIRSDPPRRDARFGLRLPTDGSAAPFRVLIGVRWVYAAIAALIALAGGVVSLPRRRLNLLLGSCAIGFGTLVAAVWQASRLKPERIALPVAGLPPTLDGFTIAQLSDFHLNRPFAYRLTRQAVAWTQQQQPDLIALTGDFVADVANMPMLDSCLVDLSARYGCCAVLGNHDYWTDVPGIERAFAHHGIDLLRNEQRTLLIDGTPLQVVGVDCVWEARHDLERALGSPPLRAPTIVLAHEPDIADEVAPFAPIVQLSGHTHAGHIAMPLLGPFFLPRHGFRYFRGLQRVGAMWLYVSRGIGGIPLRLGSPPEATLITLRAVAQES